MRLDKANKIFRFLGYERLWCPEQVHYEVDSVNMKETNQTSGHRASEGQFSGIFRELCGSDKFIVFVRSCSCELRGTSEIKGISEKQVSTTLFCLYMSQ